MLCNELRQRWLHMTKYMGVDQQKGYITMAGQEILT